VTNSSVEQRRLHRRAVLNYRIRTGAFAWCFVVLAIHAWERDAGPGYFGVLALLFLLYPHLAYLRARYSRNSKRAEELNLYVDAALLGSWVAMLHFPTWILYAALFSTTLNATVVSGLRGTFRSLLSFAIGVGIVFVVLGVDIQDKDEAALAFIRNFSLTFKNSPDRGGKVSVDYGIYGVPETFFIDREGRIARKHVGAVTDQVFRETVDALLAAK